jgi:zinc/manganese transport system substrate-binding protein
LSLFLALVLACSGNDGEATQPDGAGSVPTVIATTSILGDVVGRVGGDGIELDLMIPPGVDPHDFSPSAQQVASISSADLIVANGLGLEEGLGDVLEQAESEGIAVLRTGEGVDPLPSSAEPQTSNGFDPHFWQDPLRMKTAVAAIGQSLTEAGVAGASAGATEYQAALDATNTEIVSILAAVPPEQRLLVTNHDAFAYFADRYDFEVIGTLVPGGSTLAEPSSAAIAALVDLIVANDVPAIFVENIDNSGLAQVLADEAGRPIEVVQLVSDALGEPGSETGSYEGMLIYNARAIAGALVG